MRDAEIVRKLLQIESPWNVDRVKVDAGGKELHVYLVAGKSWFGKTVLSRPKIRWQHINIGTSKIYIHATIPDGSHEFQECSFLGGIDNDFTYGLAQQVTKSLEAGLSYRQVCDLLGIDVHLAWQIRHSIGEGRLGKAEDLSDNDLKEAPQHKIPPTGDPVWFQLLESKESIDIRLLGLKLLLARCRQEFPELENNDAKIMRVNTVRRFFIKHEKKLRHEIAQLPALNADSLAEAES